jgi:hypothetical protein
MAIPRQHVDDSVEVAMFHVEFNNTAVNLLDVDHVGISELKSCCWGWEDAIFRYGLQL